MREYYLAKQQFGEINIGDLDKIISYMRLKYSWVLILMCTYCLTGMTEMQSYRYGSQTTSQNMYTRGEELHYHAWRRFLPILLVVASSLTVSSVIWSFTSWSWHSDNKFSNVTFSFSEGFISSLQIPQQCHAFRDTCVLMYIGNYYWWIKRWWFCPNNRQ